MHGFQGIITAHIASQHIPVNMYVLCCKWAKAQFNYKPHSQLEHTNLCGFIDEYNAEPELG